MNIPKPSSRSHSRRDTQKSEVRQNILAELAVSREIVAKGSEVVPRFTIFAPDGSHLAMVQLTQDQEERRKRFDMVKLFMVWKAASGFMMAAETAKPDAISVIAVTRTEVLGAFQRIKRAPLSFSDPEWLDRDEIGDEIVSLLPPKVLKITMEEMVAMRQAFEEGIVPGISWQTEK